jgi:dipeptidyl aminopeptidase/acylaminoacyl peptidase
VLPDIQKGSADGVSPDGRWLAFGGTIKNIKGLFILGPSGEIQTVFPWQDKWNGVQSWLDSERLIMIFTKKEPIAVDLLNPFIGDVRTLNPGLDDVFVFGIESPGPNSWYIWKLVYDPSLSRLVYLRDNGNLNELSMVMIDLNSKETIWEFESPEGADLNIPVWSPNGEKLLFVSKSVVGDPFQLFTIDKNGVEIKWIHLQHDPGVASEWHWSPDSQHIAFFSNTSLYVLDIQTKQLVDFCIPYRTGFSDPIKGIFQNIYWSPDSSQILFQRYDAPAIVIDLETLVAVPIVESTQFKPIGWIKGEN